MEMVEQAKSILENWLSPTAAMMVFGGVVWGVQLNFAVMTMSEEMSRVNDAANSAEMRTDELADNLLRLSIVVEGLESRMDAEYLNSSAHRKASEEWRRRIIALEAKEQKDN